MKISPILNNYIYNTNKNIQKNGPSYINTQSNTNNIYTFSFYPVLFSGGKSMNLAETKTALDKIPNSYPPDIKEDIERILAGNNPEDKTLIDVHKDKYALLTACETLEEAKELYPEFSSVLSDEDVIYKENSFIDEVKNNQVRGFDPDIDVALQILQLYWGEGFSLPTLRDDYADKNIGYTFRKLGIPRVNPVYGQYLKLSDKDYNERYTKTISERAAEIERKRIEKQEGVYVPRGPMSDEQKAKISESLKKYYINNPDRLQEMSRRQTEYFEQYPEERAKLAQVSIRAWNYKEADSVKKKITKIMNKPSLTEEDIKCSLIKGSKQHQIFSEFWKKNPWARKIMSDCMKKSWLRQDELTDLGLIYEPLYQIKIMPSVFKKDIAEFAKDEMPDIVKYVDYIIMDPRDSYRYNGDIQLQSDKVLKAMEIGSRYFNSNDKASREAATVYSIATMSAIANLGALNQKTKGKMCPNFNSIIQKFQNGIDKYYDSEGKVDARGAANIFNSLVDLCITNNDKNSIKEFENSLEKTANEYRNFMQTHTEKDIARLYAPHVEKINKVMGFDAFNVDVRPAES